MVKANVIPSLSNICWTASLWKFLEIALTVCKGGTLCWKHLPQTVQATGIFWQIQRRRVVQSTMHSKEGLHQNTFSSFRKGSSHKFTAMFCHYRKAQFHSKNFFFINNLISVYCYQVELSDVLDRRIWRETLWPEIKTVVSSGVCLFWKEAGKTPTNPPAIHLWQTDALIRNDSFATGSKPTCTTTLVCCRESCLRATASPAISSLPSLPT